MRVVFLADQSFLASISNGDYDQDTICSGDFLAERVLRPVAEGSIRALLEACASAPSKLLPDSWAVCSNGQFDCRDIFQYTKTCEDREMRYIDALDVPTTTEGRHHPSCGMGDFLEQWVAILLLVALVFIGVLIGVAVTVGVCLICPGIHAWANSKVRRDKRLREKSLRMRQSHMTNSSSYYTDINDTFNQLSVGNPLDRQESGESTASDRPVLPVHNDMDTPTYMDSGVPANIEPGYTDASDDNMAESYEALKRTNTAKQSHKYAHLHGLDSVDVTVDNLRPCNSPETENGKNYFVLEKV